MTPTAQSGRMAPARQVWTTSVALIVSFGLYRMGEITGAQLTHATLILAGIYVGNTTPDDGLRHVLAIWTEMPNHAR